VKGADLAIASLSVKGSVSLANILAGYDTTGANTNSSAQTGAVSVGQNWIASNLVAGVANGDSPFNVYYGNDNDQLILTRISGVLSKIASVTVGGEVIGTASSVISFDHFGFVASQFGTFKLAGNRRRGDSSGDNVR
jgi:hypothetical protein